MHRPRSAVVEREDRIRVIGRSPSARADLLEALGHASTPAIRLTPLPTHEPGVSRSNEGAGGRGHFRLRYDTTDSRGAMTLRRGGRLYHLKVGAAWARRRVLAIVDAQEVTVVALDTGEILSTHRIEPDKGYWRNTRRDPGRWPAFSSDRLITCVADVATQDIGWRGRI